MAGGNLAGLNGSWGGRQAVGGRETQKGRKKSQIGTRDGNERKPKRGEGEGERNLTHQSKK